jgi:protein gp37
VSAVSRIEWTQVTWNPVTGRDRISAGCDHLAGWQPPPTRPAVVLDPFCGTATTVMVARAPGRLGVGVELSAAYCRVAAWRVRHSGHAASALARINHERQGCLEGLEDMSGLPDRREVDS